MDDKERHHRITENEQLSQSDKENNFPMFPIALVITVLLTILIFRCLHLFVGIAFLIVATYALIVTKKNRRRK